MQVEAGLDAGFLPTAEVNKQAGRFLPVAWVWRDGMSMPSAVCEVVHDEDAPNDDERAVKHKMPPPN